MWLLFGLCSSLLLGFWDIAKKIALRDNNAIKVLLGASMCGALIFLPFIILSKVAPTLLPTALYVVDGDLRSHLMIIVKAMIVGSSWTMGYYSIKNLPITIVGPVKASRPVMVLLGAILLFGERLNIYQWCGVVIALGALFLLSLTGKREGIELKSNKWLVYCILSTMMGGVSALYDKHLLGIFEPMFVQSWFSLYAFIITYLIFRLSKVLGVEDRSPFHWNWAIVAISALIAVADLLYFHALSYEESMISVISLIRRGSAIVSFVYGAVVLGEKNVKRKVVALSLMFVGLGFLALGSL